MSCFVVTGGAGFIGSNLAKRLTREDDQVYIIDDFSTGFERNLPEGAVFFPVDVANLDELLQLKLPQKVDAVFHLAAQSSGEASFDDPARDIDVNYKGTYNMLRLAEQKHADRFIYTSSMSVYGEVDADNIYVGEDYECNPISYYGNNKLASEKLINIFARHSKIKPTIFRLFNVYGPGQNLLNMKQGMVSIYLSYIMKNEPILVKGSLDRFRDLVYIDDVIDAIEASIDSPATFGETYNLGTGVKTTVSELLMAILTVYNKTDFEKWVICSGNTAGDVTGLIANNSKIKSSMKWDANVNIIKGIGEMKQWADDTKELWRI